MDKKKTAGIDFDTWAEMARDDPDAFESMRVAAIEAVIEGAREPSRERLRRLQWRIDQERRLAGTPMASCLRISRMMWRSVLGPGGLNERLGELQRRFGGGAPESTTNPPLGGQVVAFARTRD